MKTLNTRRMCNQVIHLIVAISIILVLYSPARGFLREQGGEAYVDPALYVDNKDKLLVIITAKDSDTARRAVETVGGQVTSDLWLINAVAATINANVVRTLASQDGIRSIVANRGTESTGGRDWDGYASHIRIKKNTHFTAKSTIYQPVSYLPDGAFVTIDQNGYVQIVNPDGSIRVLLTLSGGTFTSPAAFGSDGTIYVSGQAMSVYALGTDGSVHWQFVVTGSKAKFLDGPVLGSDGTLYIADSLRSLYAIDSASGQLQWKVTLGSTGSVVAAPSVGSNGLIFVSTDKGFVYAVDRSGAIKWTYNTATTLGLRPLAGPNDVLVVVNKGGKLVFSLDANTGTLKFKFTAAGTIQANPLVHSDGRVYLPTSSGLYGIDRDGTQLFLFAASGAQFTSSPVFSADSSTIFANGTSSKLFAIDPGNGAQKWVYTLPGKALGSPALDLAGNVVIGTDQKLLVILSPVGRLLQTQPTSDKVTQSPSVSPTGDITVRVGTAGLNTWELMPDQYDGVTPDAAAVPGCDWPTNITSACLSWALVNPVVADIGADQVHNTILPNGQAVTGKDVTIAVVDTGNYIDPFIVKVLGSAKLALMFTSQADFVDKVCDVTGNGFVQGNGYCLRPPAQGRDGNGHGSIVSSIIINGFKDANTGVSIGVAPGAQLMSVRVLGSNGTGTYADVVQGIQYVVSQKASFDASGGTSGTNVRIMNLSLSSYATVPYFVDPINRAVEAAWANGIVVVAAAGNTGPQAETITVPGNDPYVITVGALNDKRTAGYWEDDLLPAFSATGPTTDGFVKPDVLAPGTQIVGWMYSGQMVAQEHADHSANTSLFRMSGTSTATPIVSGVVALMLQVNPNLTPDEVKFRLKYTARPAVRPEGDPVYSPMQQGNGRVWAPDAVLGVNFPLEKDNASMDLQSDLAHDDMDFAYHYPGPVQRILSDDGQAYLYFVQDADGKVLALGAVRAADKTWLDRETIGTLSWNAGQWAWPVDSMVNTGGSYAWNGGSYAWNGGSYAWNGGSYAWNGGSYAWNGGSYAWNGGSYAWNGGSYAWNGGSYAWNGGSYAWNGGSYAWNGGSYAWNGGSYAWNGGSYAWNGGSYAWNGGAVDATQETIGATRWVEDP